MSPLFSRVWVKFMGWKPNERWRDCKPQITRMLADSAVVLYEDDDVVRLQVDDELTVLWRSRLPMLAELYGDKRVVINGIAVLPVKH